MSSDDPFDPEASDGPFPRRALDRVALKDGSLLTVLVLSCAVGQMVGKGALYGVMRWASHRLPDRARRLLGRVEALSHRPGLLEGTVFTGAAAGLPPFHIVTLASGLAGLPLLTSFVAGLGGCLLRYGVLIWGAGALGWGGVS